MRRIISLLALAGTALLLGFDGSSRAAGQVLVYCDQSHPQSGTYCSSGEWSFFDEVYREEGLEVQHVGVFPKNLLDYQVVFFTFPAHSFTKTEFDQVWKFLHRGRRLVLVGEFDGYDSSIEHFNDLLQRLDVEARFERAALDAGCGHSSKLINEHRLTRDVASFEYACSTWVSGGKRLVSHRDVEGSIVAWDLPRKDGPPNGDIVLVGDSNPFTDQCNPAANAQLLRNLLAW